MGISFFNKPSHKKFELPARYSDEQKSDFERRMKNWKKDKDIRKGNFNKEEFRDELRKSWTNSRESKSSFNKKYTNSRRMMVLVIIVAIIVWVMYYLGNKYLV